MKPRERLIVALDVATPEAARALVDRLAGHVGMFKIGSQLFTAAGPDLVREVVGRGEQVFLDLKYHDIPNTVAGGTSSARVLGAALLTVHALGGSAMIRAAREALGHSATRLIAITVLTSHSQASLAELGLTGAVASTVRRLARLAQDAGAHGVVASPQEAEAIRAECGASFLVVTPGIRPVGSAVGDQARAATPAAAVGAGADYIVVGRPVIEAADPAAAADAIVASLGQPAD